MPAITLYTYYHAYDIIVINNIGNFVRVIMFGQFGFLDLGAPELLLILLIVLLLFGGRKLPELARSVGSSLGELRKGLSGNGNENDQKQTDEKARQESNS
jgi:sec-independent protein translocase protein TatA